MPAKKRKKDPTPNLAPPENNPVRRPTKPVKKKAIPAAKGKAEEAPVAATSKVDPVPAEKNPVRRPSKPVKKKAIPAAEGKAPVATTSKADPVPAENSQVRRPSKPAKKKAIPAAEGKAPEALGPATSKVEPVPRRTSPRYSLVELTTIPFLLDIRTLFFIVMRLKSTSSTINERPRGATKKLAQSVFEIYPILGFQHLTYF